MKAVKKAGFRNRFCKRTKICVANHIEMKRSGIEMAL